MPLVAAAGISAVAGIAGGLLNRPKTTTTTPTYTTDQQEVQHDVADSLKAKLANPGQPFQSAKVAAISDVNKQTSNLETRLQSQFSARGFGSSGKIATNAEGIEAGRVGEIGGLDAKFAGQQAEYENQITDEAQRFAWSGQPSTSTTNPGNVAGGAVGGFGSAATLFALNHFLKGGSGGGGFSETSTPTDGLPTDGSPGDYGGEF